MKSPHQKRSFFALLEGMGEDAWEQSLQKGEVTVSAKFWRDLGYDPDLLPLAREAAQQLVHPLDLELVEEELALHLRSQEPFELEFRLYAATGEWRFVRLRGCVIETDVEGSPLFLAGSIRDLTDSVHAARSESRARAKIDTLSKREFEVLHCLVAGAANKNIAYALGLSRRTVEGYRARVLDKLNAKGIGELIQIALSAGVTPGTPVSCGMTARPN